MFNPLQLTRRGGLALLRKSRSKMQGMPCGDVTRHQFPAWALLPKRETGVETLLVKNGSFDGKGVIIAVFDSGIDPFAPGLQITTDGKQKIIDRIDASGAGDVDTSTVVKANEGFITGLTGRKLQIPPSWVNPSGDYHIGVKAAYSLYPQKLKERIIKEKKDKFWDPVHKTLLAEAQKQVQSYEAGTKNSNSLLNGPTSNDNSKYTGENGNASPDEKSRLSDTSDCTNVPSCSSHFEKMHKENAEVRVSLLKNLEKKYNDLGPSYDCVVFNDGQMWRVCIDTSETGNLSDGVILGEYRKDFSCKYLTSKDQYTVSVNVHNDGNILEIVGMCSSHGTHVASIAAAHFPDNPVKNGVAPGAQIVSIQLGDNRLGSMETGTALMRAMARVMDNPDYKVDVINMSYGEHGHWSNLGRIGEIANEVINKYGVIWVSSAGNHGPALATIGVPPDFFCDSVIGVGAYVSPEMMSADHAMIDKLPGCPYTWSSRGPTADGGRGVSVCAPGGAITSVPNFTLKKNMLMNGTSMSSPHAAGCIALLLSAMKQKGIPYSPYSIRRALQNTALHLDADSFAQGHGLIQVHKALDYLIETNDGSVEYKIDFIIDCGKDHGKGIHLRNWDGDRPTDIAVTVEPLIIDDSRADPSDKTNFSLELMLTCDAPWVRFPLCLQMSYMARTFKVSLDPKGLPKGDVYFSSIKAYSSDHPEKGPYFEVPVTMVVPCTNLALNCQFSRPPEHYSSAKIRRTFLSVPLEATYATVTLKSSQTDKTQRFTLHAVQLKPSCSVTTLEFYKILNLGCNESVLYTFAVRGGLTLELCLARFWNCLSNGYLEMNVEFHSVLPSQQEICFATSDGVYRVDVRVSLRNEELLPQATLKHMAMVLMPVESRVEVLGGPRDTIPEGRPIYRLVLSYNLTITKSGVEIMPKCSLLNDVLYEGAFESQLWMLFDSNKQLLGAGDAFYKKYTVKLEKGEYVIRLHVRHEKSELLDKLTDLPLTILIKLNQEIKLDIYTSYNHAVTGGRKVQSLIVNQGSIQPFYITPPTLSDKVLKSMNIFPGCSLLGTLSFSKDELVRKADSYPMRVFITEVACKKRNLGTSGTEEKREIKTWSDYQDTLRDMQTSWITKLDSESSEMLYKDVKNSHPDHLPVLLSRLQALDSEDPMNRQSVISLAKEIINSIDTAPLLAFYGTKTDTRPDAHKIRNQMDRQKNCLVEALARQGNALCAEMLANGEDKITTESVLPVDDIAMEIVKFLDPTDSKVITFFYNYYSLRGFDALAARLATKMCEDKWTKENDARLLRSYSRLSWTHAVQQMEYTYCTRFPPNYMPF